jgi:probable addiction module antidote protein
MPKRTVAYREWLQDRLKDPKVATNYLRGVLRDSPELFPKALRKVAEARGLSLSKVAETAGVERESVYRMLSETGNPTWLSLRGVVKALALRLSIEPAEPTLAVKSGRQSTKFNSDHRRRATSPPVDRRCV